MPKENESSPLALGGAKPLGSGGFGSAETLNASIGDSSGGGTRAQGTDMLSRISPDAGAAAAITPSSSPARRRLTPSEIKDLSWRQVAPALTLPNLPYTLVALLCAFKAGAGAGQMGEAFGMSGDASYALTTISTLVGTGFYYDNAVRSSVMIALMWGDSWAWWHDSLLYLRGELGEGNKCWNSQTMMNPLQILAIAIGTGAFSAGQAFSLVQSGGGYSPLVGYTMGAALALGNLELNPTNLATFLNKMGLIPTGVAERYKISGQLKHQSSRERTWCAFLFLKLGLIILPAVVNIFGGMGAVLSAQKWAEENPIFATAMALLFGVLAALAVPGMCFDGIAKFFNEVDKSAGWGNFFKNNGLGIFVVVLMCGIPSNWLGVAACYNILNLLIGLYRNDLKVASMEDYMKGEVGGTNPIVDKLALAFFSLVLFYGVLSQSLNKGDPFNKLLEAFREFVLWCVGFAPGRSTATTLALGSGESVPLLGVEGRVTSPAARPALEDEAGTGTGLVATAGGREKGRLSSASAALEMESAAGDPPGRTWCDVFRRVFCCSRSPRGGVAGTPYQELEV